jgi:type I restriction enzyme S subunit
MEYQRLGNYIREVNVRNRELKVTNLLGLSMSKQFRPSTSNIVGVDLTKYKVVDRNVFAFDPMSVIRVHKVPIAINDTNDPIIVSPAYYTFEVIDSFQLLPQYLMMWFQRTEFDRYADFKSDAAVRGGYDWDELCNTPIYIPSITRQREIVSEYETLTNRIRLNNQMIQHLEATAQTLYRKTFVDNIDKENLPEGWRMGRLTDIATYLNGTACQKYETDGTDFLPVLKIRELSQGYCDENSDHVEVSIPQEYVINTGDVVFSWSATLFIDIWCGGKCALNQHLFKVASSEFPTWFFFLWTQNHIAEWKRLISAKATSMGHIKREDLETAQVIIPSEKSMMELNKKMHPFFEMYILKKQENLKLTELQSLLLAKMGQ